MIAIAMPGIKAYPSPIVMESQAIPARTGNNHDQTNNKQGDNQGNDKPDIGEWKTKSIKQIPALVGN